LEECPNCDYKILPDGEWDGVGVDECECVECDICEERKDHDSGDTTDGGWTCYDCWEEHTPVDVFIGDASVAGEAEIVVELDGREVAFSRDFDGEEDESDPNEHIIVFRFKGLSGRELDELMITVKWEKDEDGHWSWRRVKKVEAVWDGSDIVPRQIAWKLNE
jgi:hypothetical protein